MTIENTLTKVFDEKNLIKMVFSNRRKKSNKCSKITVRPIILKNTYMYQAEYHHENKSTHENIDTEGILLRTLSFLDDFKQVNIYTQSSEIQILASKKENPRITVKVVQNAQAQLSHNKEKNYIIKEGIPCDFLVLLGVMTKDGNIIPKYYSKFRQINRFLEIVDDVYDNLPQNRTIKIVDFGCGKSYLTFALYHYLHIVKNKDIEVIGLDLKTDVIEFCNKVARSLKYDHLHFITGDISDYNNDFADMVVTLHACDTATDYALINAVHWNTSVILSVPCCQHELFSQIDNSLHNPMFKHGIIKDKFTELLTDALRGLKLEEMGYNVSMIEFTSLEHTSKNIMIKAVKSNTSTKKQDKAYSEYTLLKEYYNVSPSIDKLRRGK